MEKALPCLRRAGVRHTLSQHKPTQTGEAFSGCVNHQWR